MILRSVNLSNSKMPRKIIILLLALVLLVPQPVSAQTTGPVYIVQPGDTLWSIAVRFNVSLDDLMNANNLTDSNLAAGQQLIIPGLEGLTGFLNTEVVGFGDSLRGLARRNQVSVSLLQRLNHIISPSELYVGVSLIVPQQEGVSKLPGLPTSPKARLSSNWLSARTVIRGPYHHLITWGAPGRRCRGTACTQLWV